jgi:tryptophan synthase beta chain
MAYLCKIAGSLPKDAIVVANLSGRGDKDVEQASKYLLAED